MLALLRNVPALLALAAYTAVLAYRRASALLALVAYAAVLAYRRASALLAYVAFAAVLAYRHPSTLFALVALATVRAYCRASAILALVAYAAVLAPLAHVAALRTLLPLPPMRADRRPAAQLAHGLSRTMLTEVLPLLAARLAPLEAAPRHRHVLVHECYACRRLLCGRVVI